jgi:hypothetical protein
MSVQLAQQAQAILGQSDWVIPPERADDVALLIGQMVTRGVPEVLARPMPRHWTQRGRRGAYKGSFFVRAGIMDTCTLLVISRALRLRIIFATDHLRRLPAGLARRQDVRPHSAAVSLARVRAQHAPRAVGHGAAALPGA